MTDNDKIEEIAYLLSSLKLFTEEEKQQINAFINFLRSKETWLIPITKKVS